MKGNTVLEGLLGSYASAALTKVDYCQVKDEAINGASGLGYEVVVVDFADPQNMYGQDYRKRWELERDYGRRKVIFFHENVARANPNHIQSARAHMDETHAKGHAGNVFITTFDEIDPEDYRRLSEPLVSTYFSRWGRTPPTSEKAKYVDETAGSLIAQITGLDERGERGAFDIIGLERSGKTSVLIRVANYRRHHGGMGLEYNTMLSFAGEPEGRIMDLLYRRNHSPRGLLLDEADKVSGALHHRISERYRVVVYASHIELPFPDTRKIFLEPPDGVSTEKAAVNDGE